MMRKNKADPRGGKSLIEMITVIAIMSMLFPVSANFIWRIMRASSANETAVNTTVVLSQLSKQFHRDAHAAISVKTNPQQPGSLSFQMNDSQIVSYIPEKNQIIRKQSQGEKIVAQEIYRLPGRKSALQIQQAGKWVSITVQPVVTFDNTLPATSVHTRWIAKAVVGRSHRFNNIAAKEENE